MAELDIKWLQDKNKVKYFPVAHMNGVVVDSNGSTVGSIISTLSGNVNTVSGNVTAVDNRVTQLSGKTISAGTGISITNNGALSATPSIGLATASITLGYTGNGITSNTVSVDNYGRVSQRAAIIYNVIKITTSQTNVTCSTSITASTRGGYQYNVIYHNTGSTDCTIAVSTSSGYITPDGSPMTLTCKAGGYVELNYLNINGTIYVRGV